MDQASFLHIIIMYIGPKLVVTFFFFIQCSSSFVCSKKFFFFVRNEHIIVFCYLRAFNRFYILFISQSTFIMILHRIFSVLLSIQDFLFLFLFCCYPIIIRVSFTTYIAWVARCQLFFHLPIFLLLSVT